MDYFTPQHIERPERMLSHHPAARGGRMTLLTSRAA